MKLNRQSKRLIALACVAVVLWLVDRYNLSSYSVDSPTQKDQAEFVEGRESIVEAFTSRRSDVLVSANGRVSSLLADDLEGSHHQRFILDIGEGTTVLIAHNIDIAPKVPLKQGDLISFQGEYEWNEKGGVVHWTHHDPNGRHPGGWIDLEGKKYE